MMKPNHRDTESTEGAQEMGTGLKTMNHLSGPLIGLSASVVGSEVL